VTEPDDTDMTPEEFRAAMANGIPVEVVYDPEDVALIAELERRLARDTGGRHSLDDVMARLGITREDLEEDA
jgi:hypothetical protein